MQTLQKVLPKYTIALALVFFVTVAYLLTRGNTVDVEAGEVTYAELVQAIYATGFVEAEAVANLSSELSGTVNYIGALEGQQVTAGQTIISLDNAQPGISVREAQAAFLEQQAVNQEKTMKYSRARNLFREGALARQDLDEAKRISSQAEELLEQKRLQLKSREDELKKIAITAPFAGVLTLQSVKKGDYVTANMLVARVVDTSKYVVSVEIDELDVPRIRPGQAAVVVLDALPTERYDAVVSRIVPQTDTITKTSRVYLTFRKAVTGIQAGMTITANIVYHIKPHTLLVRKSSVFDDNHKSYVWEIEKGKLKKQLIVTGASDLTFVEVLSGLQQGDRVALLPEERLREGMDANVLVAKAGKAE
jgi:RND family efflux transporter MFP subunit